MNIWKDLCHVMDDQMELYNKNIREPAVKRNIEKTIVNTDEFSRKGIRRWWDNAIVWCKRTRRNKIW